MHTDPTGDTAKIPFSGGTVWLVQQCELEWSFAMHVLLKLQ